MQSIITLIIQDTVMTATGSKVVIIITITAIEGIVTGSAQQGIIAIPTQKRISASFSFQQVVAITTI